MTAQELQVELERLAAARAEALRQLHEHEGLETEPCTEEWEHHYKVLYAADRAAWTECNKAFASFLGGYLGQDGPFKGRHKLTKFFNDRSWLAEPHLVLENERPLALIAHSHAPGCLEFYQQKAGELVARRLALTSWSGAPGAAVIMVMRADAPQWATLRPLFAQRREGA